MKEFASIDEYYAYLENDNNFSHLDLNTYKYITVLRDKTEDDNTKKLCSYELFFADFSIEKGVQVPKWQIGGQVYPTLELFDDNFEYIKSRANTVENPKYKSKYNHLLWLSPQRHIDFAKQAIESYFLLLENSSFPADDNLLCISFGKKIENLFLLSQSVNYKWDEVINYFLTLLESAKLNDFTKFSLMKFIIENSKNNNTTVTQIFFEYSKQQLEHLDLRVLESYLQLLVILSQKLNTSPSEFHEKLGDYQISQLQKEKNQGFIAHHYYVNALEEYKKANNKTKIEETAVLIEKAKKTIDLKKISLSLEEDEEMNKLLNQWWENIKVETDQLIETANCVEIYEYLIFKDFFPKAEKLGEEINTPFLDLVTTISFDINKNVSKKKTSGINPYFLHINNFSIRQIWLVFLKGIKSGKISFESLIIFFKNNSWYGKDFTYTDTNNEMQGFDWIELLSPSLQSFFVQTEIDIKTNKHHSQGYILAIDSLVLKFEGLLRELSRMIGAQTIEIKADGTQERISFEKLLENEKTKALIPEDDLAYFKFLFLSDGMNLRNNIAHSFYSTKHYDSATMLLLIVALLRLGNFEINTAKNNDE